MGVLAPMVVLTSLRDAHPRGTPLEPPKVIMNPPWTPPWNPPWNPPFGPESIFCDFWYWSGDNIFWLEATYRTADPVWPVASNRAVTG